MQTGKIIRHNGQAGIIAGELLPTGKIPCWFGNETRRQEIKAMPFELVVVDLIDLSHAEYEGLLPLMQALVFRLIDDRKAF